MAFKNISLVSVLWSNIRPAPQWTMFAILCGWSKNTGMPRTGIPLSMASYIPDMPQWEINNFTFLCAKKKLKKKN